MLFSHLQGEGDPSINIYQMLWHLQQHRKRGQLVVIQYPRQQCQGSNAVLGPVPQREARRQQLPSQQRTALQGHVASQPTGLTQTVLLDLQSRRSLTGYTNCFQG